MTTTRRNFMRGLAGASAFAIGGCKCPFGEQKIKLACVGVMGKGFSDWFPMIKSGMAELVALCDCDYSTLEKAQVRLYAQGIDVNLYNLPFYTDYRNLLDNAPALGVEAMTISTPDHVHAAVAIQAMKLGIHVYVQKPLVRTLWELKYFEDTAKDNGVITQMGNQGSSLDSMRRCTEIIQSGIIGEATEVHVWTDRPVWPQGKAVADWVKGHPNGDPMRKWLNWDAWLATAEKRPFLDKYPDNADVYDPWKLGKNVYHTFTWRGFFDFGCGAFGDMACHTMNLAFRGLELGGVSEAVCDRIESMNDIAYPLKSRVKLTYKARTSRYQKDAEGNAKKLPPVTLYWYDGGYRPETAVMEEWAATHEGKIPNTGCYIIGTKGSILMQDDYGAKCAMLIKGEKTFKDIFEHEAAKSVERRIAYCPGSTEFKGGKSVEMAGFGEGQYTEFLHAIRGEGPVHEQTHSRCFSDIEYSIPQMEGILVGCIAQRLNSKVVWDSDTQSFGGNAEANKLIKPFIRKGFEF